MTMTELIPYSEAKRDRIERRLANKRELICERRQGLDIIICWLRDRNQISVQLIEEAGGREFIVPNDSVMDAYQHPEVYAARAGKHKEPETRVPME